TRKAVRGSCAASGAARPRESRKSTLKGGKGHGGDSGKPKKFSLADFSIGLVMRHCNCVKHSFNKNGNQRSMERDLMLKLKLLKANQEKRL
ncbi:hypothetical protein, partial [Acidithiobacillus sulfurivorans]|uniref:hypothetical protein n=1 Tax=Acidithiobacillus sulfurivorans TaxID=1958756 RepID=UPI001C075500